MATKRLPATTATRISNLGGLPGNDRMATWQRRLAAAASPVPATHGYSGDAWSHLTSGFAACNAASKAHWIVSPGVGLLNADTPLPNYQASFALENSERVGDTITSMQRWWEELGAAAAKDGRPAGITALAHKYPAATFLLALNADTLAVLQADIWEARENTCDPERFLVLAGSTTICHGLGSSLLTIPPRFEKFLGGPRASVTARMAHHLLVNFPVGRLRAGHLHVWLRQNTLGLPGSTPRQAPATRKKVGSLELEMFVRRELADNPKIKPSGLRRKLHGKGKSCAAKPLEVFHQRYDLPLFQIQ